MDKYKYINNYNKNKYDRIYIMLKKGLKDEIKEICKDNQISINQYINLLIQKDISNKTSNTLKHIPNELDPELIKKWQIPKKYIPMLEYISYSKENGYLAKLKDGYINDISKSRIIHAKTLPEIRLTINKSHKIIP